MIRSVLVVTAVLTAASVLPAAAQTPATSKQAGPKRPRELVLGGLVAGPTSLGSADAQLLGSSGTPTVTLFSVEDRLATGFGVEMNIGIQLRRSLWAEVGGGWTRTSLDSKITDDFEGAEDVTISSSLSRFLLEGAAVWYLRDRGKSAWFVRLNGGWMRETAGGNTLTGDGFIGGGGVGFRHWWRTDGKGAVKRLGLRVEGRGTIRSGGISIGDSTLRFGPSGAAHLVFGF